MSDFVERRRESRTSLGCPCKVLDPRTDRYLPGATVDVSSRGLQVRIGRMVTLAPGDRLWVGVAAPGTALIRRADLVEAEVVRAVRSPSGETVVGLQLPTTWQMAAAA